MARVTITSGGIDRLRTQITRRANFLGSDGIVTVLAHQAKDLETIYRNKILTFTPGKVQDLSPVYAERKQKQHGLIYPILYASGKMFNALRIRVTKTRASGLLLTLDFPGNHKGVELNTIANAHINGEGNLPKRDFTQIPKSWTTALFNRIRDALWRR